MFGSAHKAIVKASFKSLSLAATLAGVMALYAPAASAQSISTGADKPIPRLCTDRCVQAYEKVAVDGAGNAAAIWVEPGANGSGNVIVARYSASSNTWSAPQVIERQTSLGAPQIGMDGAGNIIAVWDYVFEGTAYFRFARFRVQTGTWTTPRTFLTEIMYQGAESLEVSRNGNAFLHTYGRNDFGKSYRYDAMSNSWTTLQSSTGNNSRIVADNGGNALMATGLQYFDSAIIATRYDSATRTVSRGTVLDESSTGWDEVSGYHETSVALIGASRSPVSGGEMLLWERVSFKEMPSPVTTRTLHSAVFDRNAGTWRQITVPKISNGQTLSGKLDADRFGNVNAIWVQYVSGYAKVVTARYTASAGRWSMPRVLSPGNFHTRDASLDTDNNGNVIATWSQRTDTGTGSSVGKIFRTIAVRYAIASNTWGQALTIQDVNRNSYFPHMGVSGAGRAIVLWQQDTGSFYGNGTPVKEMRADRVAPL